jgi:hypothetical protein
MKLPQIVRRTFAALMASTVTVALARLEGPADAGVRLR